MTKEEDRIPDGEETQFRVYRMHLQNIPDMIKYDDSIFIKQ